MPIELPEGAVETHGIHVVSYITQDGGSAYVVNATGDSSMTAYLGLLVVAQQEILRWNDDDA